MIEHSNVTIDLDLTVPFGCLRQDGHKTDCALTVEMRVPKATNGQCSGTIAPQAIHCRQEIQSYHWNETTSILLQYKNIGTYTLGSNRIKVAIHHGNVTSSWDTEPATQNIDVRKFSKNEKLHTIFFPTGTKVVLTTSVGYMNVEIKASVHDYKKTRGLCGYMSDDNHDDFRWREDTGIPPDDFSDSWK
ncbi:unnamed protein product [Mytilus edulis]|uniref:VWFD domain-containing protein n=1 Tax=Mytilus edulis TaxID=6550 RepID=A0A8S3SI25_MYTED|nr:unnamed protein product [Mytilus edulis]